MPKNILLAFIGNACSFIHPVAREDYEILVSLLIGTFKKATKKGLKRLQVRFRMNK